MFYILKELFVFPQAVQETFIGIGMMVGPTIGGALFEVGVDD